MANDIAVIWPATRSCSSCRCRGGCKAASQLVEYFQLRNVGSKAAANISCRPDRQAVCLYEV